MYIVEACYKEMSRSLYVYTGGMIQRNVATFWRMLQGMIHKDIKTWQWNPWLTWRRRDICMHSVHAVWHYGAWCMFWDPCLMFEATYARGVLARLSPQQNVVLLPCAAWSYMYMCCLQYTSVHRFHRLCMCRCLVSDSYPHEHTHTHTHKHTQTRTRSHTQTNTHLNASSRAAKFACEFLFLAVFSSCSNTIIFLRKLASCA